MTVSKERVEAPQGYLPLKPLNHVISSCPPSGIRRFFDIAASMEGVISLGVGEPDFVTPAVIREEGIRSLQQGHTGYTGNSGLPALRESICRDIEGRYRVSYNPDTECLITVGVSEALDLALRVLINPGDEIIIPEPCYVSYIPCVQFAGGNPVLVRTESTDNFRLHAETVEELITPHTKAILVASPANPTGATQSKEDLQRIVNLAVKYNLYIISDEIYGRLIYDGESFCTASLHGARERTLTLNGFSKSHAMTGWRVGYACGPEPALRLMVRVHQYTMLCASRMAQEAAIVAIESADGDVDTMASDYNRRRLMFVEGLNRIGLTCPLPQGAFYAFPSIRSSGLSSEEFAERLLLEQKVAVVPGNAFGPSGEGYIRCCYATATPKLEEALLRMESFLKGLNPCS